MNSRKLPQASTRSRAAIRGHPLHPIVLPFPLVFLTSVLLTDIIFFATRDAFWTRAGTYLLAAGILTGLIAGILGAVDFVSIRQARAHRVGWVHSTGNVVALSLAAVNLILRWDKPVLDITSVEFVLSLVTVLLLGVTGWAGGEMSYRHRVGVDDMV